MGSLELKCELSIFRKKENYTENISRLKIRWLCVLVSDTRKS